MDKNKIYQQQGLQRFVPFPRNCINLIIGPSSVGKTFFVTQLISHYPMFFTPPLHRILFILCNDRVGPIQLQNPIDLPVQVISIGDFHPDILEPGDVVVVDDLLSVTDSVRDVVTVCAHHNDLSALFVITHSLLGSKNFELLQLVHRLFLFMRATTNQRLAKYVIRHFFQDQQVRHYLHQVLSFGQLTNDIVALEINPIVNKKSFTVETDRPVLGSVLAFSHLTHLIQDGYCLVYPYPTDSDFLPSQKKEKMDHFKGYESDHEEQQQSMLEASDIDASAIKNFPQVDAEKFPQPTLVAVPVQVVLEALYNVKLATGKSDKAACNDEKKQWLWTNFIIQDMIRNFVDSDKWKKAENIAREMLSNGDYCITEDGKCVFKKDKPDKTKIFLSDFLTTVLRRAGPKEKLALLEGSKKQLYTLYSMYVRELISRGAPVRMFENKMLLPKHLQ